MTTKKHKKKQINMQKAYITVKKWEKITTKALKTSTKWDRDGKIGTKTEAAPHHGEILAQKNPYRTGGSFPL